MTNDPDFLNRLWSEVVNPDSEGKWIESSIEFAKKRGGPHAATAVEALNNLRQMAQITDLAQVSRLIRYEALFEMLCAFEETGLARKTSEILETLKAWPSGSKPKGRLGKYIRELGIDFEAEPDVKWLVAIGKRLPQGAPFAEAGPAVKKILQTGVNKEDLAQFALWGAYEAIVLGHEILHQCKLDEEGSVEGLHEAFLSADPSGLEGRTGSWPLSDKPIGSGSKFIPMWKTRSGQAIAFSPDGERVAIAGASGPARIFNAATGEELVVCEGLKLHIIELAFSTDGSQLAMSENYHPSAVCDASTGKLLRRSVFPKSANPWAEVCGLVYTRGGELLRCAGKQMIDVVETRSFEALEALRPAANTRGVDGMVLYNEGRTLAAVWSAGNEKEHRITVWSWPSRVVQLRFGFPGQCLTGIDASWDGEFLATVSDMYSAANNKSEGSVYLFDSKTGAQLRSWKGPRGPAISFGPENKLFIADDDHVSIFDLAKDEALARVRICNESDSVYELVVSNCGKFLGTTTSRGAAVWSLPELLKGPRNVQSR